jgi:transposase
MPMRSLAEQVDFVVGVDTHKHTHTFAVVTPTGGVVAQLTAAADAGGYARSVAFAREHAPGRRLWAIEGTGSFGVGLTTTLLAAGERVAEIDRPARPARRSGAKSDALDAVRAAREALAREHLAQPRRRGAREALRGVLTTREGVITARTRALCHRKALVVNAPEALRHALRPLGTDDLLRHWARRRSAPTRPAEHRATVLVLRMTARRALALTAEAAALEAERARLVAHMAPVLLTEPGGGPISAAQLLCAWSHPGRLRSEAAFAALAGVAPIPASSGQVTRHRLNRSGDRQLNRALHTIVFVRLRHHPETRAYAARRAAEGKSPRETMRCLKRHLARRLFKLLERVVDPAATDLEPAARAAALAPLMRRTGSRANPPSRSRLGAGRHPQGRSAAEQPSVARLDAPAGAEPPRTPPRPATSLPVRRKQEDPDTMPSLRLA